MEYKDKLTKIIYEWVKANFGENEADDPSWNIDALAEELAKHQHEFYWEQELEYLREDVEHYVDNQTDYELTTQQIYNVADKIRNSEWYCSINPEDMAYYIEQEVKEK